METAELLLTRFKGMESARSPYVPLWQESTDHYLPHKAFSTKSPGSEGGDLIWDSTPADSLQKLSSRLFGIIMPPSEAWLGIGHRAQPGTKDENGMKEWASRTAEKTLAFLANEETGWYTAGAESFESHCLHSMYVKYIEENDKTVLNVRCIPLSECYIAESADGIVDTLYRKYTMTVRQMVQTWGKDKLSKEVSDLWKENKPETKVDILHCTYPREDIDAKARGNKAMPWASVYIEEKNKHVIEESGYHEFPYSVPRWGKGPGEVYGSGCPAAVALPTVRVLYAQVRTATMTAEKLGSPPLLCSDDGVLGSLNTGPNGIIWYRAGTQDKPEYLAIKGDLAALDNMVERSREEIRSMCYSNRLDNEDRPNMTATEATIKRNDRWQSLAAMLGRIQNEGLTQELNRVVRILLRKGLVDPLPEGYTEKNIKFFYTNQLTQSQSQQGLQTSRVLIEMITPLIEMAQALGAENPIDNFDLDAMARRAHAVSGAPADELRKKQDVDTIRDEKAKARQAQETLQNAGAVADVAKTASGADMSSPNALTALMGRLGG